MQHPTPFRKPAQLFKVFIQHFLLAQLVLAHAQPASQTLGVQLL